MSEQMKDNAQTAAEANTIASSTGVPDSPTREENVTGKFRLVSATREHVIEIARTMRKEDRDAFYASGNLLHQESFLRCVENGFPTWAVIDEEDGKVAAVGGAAEADCLYVGVPWAATTDAISKHPADFTRIGCQLMAGMHLRFPFLANWIDARNTEHIRWLK